jgi:hypothetical protein
MTDAATSADAAADVMATVEKEAGTSALTATTAARAATLAVKEAGTSELTAATAAWVAMPATSAISEKNGCWG